MIFRNPIISSGLIAAGYLSFYIHSSLRNPLLLFSTLFLLIAIYADIKRKSSFLKLFLPFTSGLLCFLMRQFYWDKFDFNNRVNHLIIIAMVATLFLAIQRFHTIKRTVASFNRLKLRNRLILIFIFAEILFIMASFTVVRNGVKLAGDEPHYLAISQSIAQDFDLNVFNQYFRNGYKEFMDVEKLPAHATWGTGYKKLYSYHLPGVSLTLALFFLIKSSPPLLYILIRAYLGIFGALLAVLIYLISLRAWHHQTFSIIVTIFFTLTAPVFFYSFHIFPEIQAVLLILASLYLLLLAEKRNNFRVCLSGFLLGITVFWGVKYLIFIYLYVLGFLIHFLRKRKFKKALLFVIFPLLFQMLFFYYLYNSYGNLSPSSVYYGMMTESQKKDLYKTVFETTTLQMRLETFLDFFFDQRDGLLLYNPFYFFAFPGLILALRRFKTYLPHLLLSFAGLIHIFYHSFSTIRPGYSPQARYLVPVTWIMMMLAAIYYRESKNRFFKKIWLCLPLYAIFVVIYQTTHPFTLYQTTTHDYLYRPGLMFQQWGNLGINLPAILPSFIKVNNSNYWPNYLFILITTALIILSLTTTKKASKIGLVIAALIAFSLFSLFPRPALYNPITITKAHTLHHAIYGIHHHPIRREWITFTISKPGRHDYLIGTMRKTDTFSLNIESPNSNQQAKISIHHFDTLLGEFMLPLAENKKIYLENLRSKHRKNQFLYQFHITVKKISPTDKVFFKFQIFPIRRS